MKRLILILVCCILCLTACTQKVFVDSETGKVLNVNIQVESFIDLEEVVADTAGLTGNYYILRDRNTDVLYYRYGQSHQGGITPIAKPDGTFLTYKEWKENQ